MKKHLLILSAASLAVCSILSSCSSSSKTGSSAPSLSSSVSSDGEETQASALSETDIQGAYKIDKLDIPELKDHSLNRIEHVSDPDGFILDIYNEKGDSLLYTDADFKEFKKAFDEMGVKKLPTVKSLQVEFADLLTAKKEAYAELKKVRDELRDLTVHKANYEELRDLEEREKRKEKEHGRE